MTITKLAAMAAIALTLAACAQPEPEMVTEEPVMTGKL